MLCLTGPDSCTRFYSCALPRATEVLATAGINCRYNRLYAAAAAESLKCKAQVDAKNCKNCTNFPELVELRREFDLMKRQLEVFCTQYLRDQAEVG